MKFCGWGSGGGRSFQKAPSPGYALHILQHPGHPAEDTPRAVLREQRHAGVGGLFRPQDETVMIAVEEQALKRHALMGMYTAYTSPEMGCVREVSTPT